MERRILPAGPRPPLQGRGREEDDLPMPTLKEYLNAKPVQHKPYTKADGISDFLQTLFWISLALAVLYIGDGNNSLITILQTDKKLNRNMLNASMGFAGLGTAVFLYVSVYLQWFKGVGRDFYSAAPWTIPIATGSGFLTALTFTLGIWRRFSFWSLLITPVLGMGFLFTLILHDMLLGLVCLPLQYGGHSANSTARKGAPRRKVAAE